MTADQRPARKGSPWYYRDGGKRLTLKEIRHSATPSELTGVLARQVASAEKLPEPQRTERLDRLHANVRAEVRTQITAYRHAARTLNAYRRAFPDGREGHTVCAEAHSGLYVAACYLRFAFAAMRIVEGKAPQQLSLL